MCESRAQWLKKKEGKKKKKTDKDQTHVHSHLHLTHLRFYGPKCKTHPSTEPFKAVLELK